MKYPDPGFDSSDVEILERQTVWQGFFRMERVRLKHRLFAGGWSAEFDRELFMRARSAGVLLYDPELDKVVLVEQFRAGALPDPAAEDNTGSPWLLELVAGIVDEGESAAENVRREAMEEASCEVTELLPIIEYWNSPGGSDERISLFCGRVDASEAGGIHGLAEESEDIQVHVLDWEAAWQALLEGRLDNAMAIIAMQWFRINREQVRQKWLK